MLAYVQALINIALRRSGPEALPDSAFLLGLTLASYLVAQVPIALIIYGSGDVLLSMLAVSLLLLFAGLWILLRLTGYSARYRQTLTAMLGINTLVSLFQLPFSIWYSSLQDAETGPVLPSLFLFALSIWLITINGHILSRALSRPYVIGLLVSFGYFFLELSLFRELMAQGAGG